MTAAILWLCHKMGVDILLRCLCNLSVELDSVRRYRLGTSRASCIDIPFSSSHDNVSLYLQLRRPSWRRSPMHRQSNSICISVYLFRSLFLADPWHCHARFPFFSGGHLSTRLWSWTREGRCSSALHELGSRGKLMFTFCGGFQAGRMLYLRIVSGWDSRLQFS